MKEKLRQDAQKIRDRIHNPSKGGALKDNFLRNIEIPGGSVISAYWPTGTEIDIRPLITELYNRGYEICLPCVDAKDAPLSFRQWEPEAVMVKSGNFKIYEPCKKQHPEMTPNFLIVPMLAFDSNRHRLGYGGGFYDRTLEKLRRENPELIAIGVAYADQQIDKIPAEKWDIQLDRVVTESKVF